MTVDPIVQALLDLIKVVGDHPDAMFSGAPLNAAYCNAAKVLRENVAPGDLSRYVPSDADAKDAARYRYWREAHSQGGLRPFLPEIGQGRLTSRTLWTHLIYGDIENDDWIKSTPAERCTLIDKALDERMPSTCESQRPE